MCDSRGSSKSSCRSELDFCLLRNHRHNAVSVVRVLKCGFGLPSCPNINTHVVDHRSTSLKQYFVGL